MTSFLFYDIETTGLNSSFDQILTFGAIRTDLELNEIDRYMITIQMRPDIVPSPGAFITHRLMPDDWAQGICEYEGARQIHAIVNTPGTISIGYNNLGFDDEFLRFTFYRNLLDPYSHQYANGCSRMDMLPITTLYRIFKPTIIKWPTTADGKSSLKLGNLKPSLKLELISKAIMFVPSMIYGRAHHAITDVEATVALAKCLIKENDMWRYSLDFFDKNSDRTKIDKIQTSEQNSPLAIMVSHKLGAESMYMAPVLGIGRSYHYGNQSLWFRLDKDIFQFSDGSNHTPSLNFVIRKKDGETGIILPPLQRFWNRLSEEQQISANKNLILIHENPERESLFNKFVEYHRQFKYPLVPEADLDSLLYQSPFFTKSEKQKMEQFHKSSLNQKIALIEEMQSSRIKSLGSRIIFRNYPIRTDSEENSSPFILNEYNSYMAKVRCRKDEVDVSKKIIDFKREERLVPEKAIEELKHIYLQNKNCEILLDNEQKKVLEWLEGFYAVFIKFY